MIRDDEISELKRKSGTYFRSPLVPDLFLGFFGSGAEKVSDGNDFSSQASIEAVINKIKVIKRIMYSICSFELLRLNEDH